MNGDVHKPKLRLCVAALTGLQFQVFAVISSAFFISAALRPSVEDLATRIALAFVLGAVLVVGIKYAVLFYAYRRSRYRVLDDRVVLEQADETETVLLSEVVTIVLQQTYWQRRHGLGSILLATSYGMPKRSRLLTQLNNMLDGGLVIPDIADAERVFEHLTMLKRRAAAKVSVPSGLAAAAGTYRPAFVPGSVLWDLSPQLLFLTVWWTGVLSAPMTMLIAVATGTTRIPPWFIDLVPVLAAVVFLCLCGAAAWAHARATYTVGPDHIGTDAPGGLLARRRFIHASDIAGVTLHRNLWQRSRGLATLHVATTAISYRFALLMQRPLGGSEVSSVLLRDLPDAGGLTQRLGRVEWRPRRRREGPKVWVAGGIGA